MTVNKRSNSKKIRFFVVVVFVVPFIFRIRVRYETLTLGPKIGRAIGPLWDFCAPISIIVEL